MRTISTLFVAVACAACGGNVSSAPVESDASADAGRDVVLTCPSLEGGSTATCAVVDGGVSGMTCADLSFLALSEPSLSVDGGDCALTPGGTATLDVMLREVAGRGFDAYPGVICTSDVPGVTFSGGPDLFAILPCQMVHESCGIAVGSSVATGTVVHVVVQAAMIARSCPNAPAITVPLLVR
jgi:hypothetical protein